MLIDDRGSLLDPCLVETTSAPFTAFNGADTRYIALSHCWGGLQLLETRRDTYKQHLESIPSHKMSRTFRDTILVARTLGVHYLWIDSLCIVQDDEKDWAREASEMGKIYKNAWLTIAATGAIDGAQGLFLDRPGIGKIQVSHEKAGSTTVVVRPVVDHSAFANETGGGEKDTTLLPLLKRGWVLQEQLLSTRVLHFTQQELFWECCAKASCKCSPEASGGIRSFPDHRFRSMKRLVNVSCDTYRDVDIVDWYKLLAIYRQREFTYDKDMLPALSGIADGFQRAVRDPGRYLAGLWEKDLIRGLLWKVEQPGPRGLSHGTCLYSPPSWSWASVGSCGISWPGLLELGDAVHLVEVVHAWCSPITADDKGMVSGGQLTLRGKLFPLTIQYAAGVSETERHTYELNATGWTSTSGRRRRRCSTGTSRVCFDPDVLVSSMRDCVPPGSVLYFLPLQCHNEEVGWTLDAELEGIFLRRVPACSEQAEEGHAGRPLSALFERLGWGSILLPERNPHGLVGEDWKTIVTIV